MYIRYRDSSNPTNTAESIVVRDIRWFCIEPQTIDDHGTKIEGAAICDGMMNNAVAFGNAAVEYLAGYILGNEKVFPNGKLRKNVIPIGDGGIDFYSDLAWFESMEIACMILDKICQAMDEGKQFFDLTQYGEDGKLLK